MTFGPNWFHAHLEEYGEGVASSIFERTGKTHLQLNCISLDVNKNVTGLLEIRDNNMHSSAFAKSIDPLLVLSPIDTGSNNNPKSIVPISPTYMEQRYKIAIPPNSVGVTIDTYNNNPSGFYSPEIIIIDGEPIIFTAYEDPNPNINSSITIDTFAIDLLSYQNGEVSFELIWSDISSDLIDYVMKSMPCSKNDLTRIQRREEILKQILDKVYSQLSQIAGREYATLP
jgi:hypothetical protein